MEVGGNANERRDQRRDDVGRAHGFEAAFHIVGEQACENHGCHSEIDRRGYEDHGLCVVHERHKRGEFANVPDKQQKGERDDAAIHRHAGREECEREQRERGLVGRRLNEDKWTCHDCQKARSLTSFPSELWRGVE